MGGVVFRVTVFVVAECNGDFARICVDLDCRLVVRGDVYFNIKLVLRPELKRRHRLLDCHGISPVGLDPL